MEEEAFPGLFGEYALLDQINEKPSPMGVRYYISINGLIEKVALDQVAQMAVNEGTDIFYLEILGRDFLITFSIQSLQPVEHNGSAVVHTFVPRALYAEIGGKPGYKRRLVYNHNRGILVYNNESTNGSEGDQNGVKNEEYLEGSGILPVFNYPNEILFAIGRRIEGFELGRIEEALEQLRRRRREELALLA